MKLKIDNDSTTNLMDTQDLSSDVHSANGSAEVTEMLRKGIKAAQDGNRAEARHLLMEATELEPKNENAWLWLASISEYPEELLIFLNNVLKVNPKNERALEWEKSTKSLLSKTFVKRGIEAAKESQAAVAKQSFLQAIVHDDKNEMAWLWLASISDSVDEKKSHLHKVLKINPDNETAANSLKSVKRALAQDLLRSAQVEAIAGRVEAAKKMVAEVLRDDSEIEGAWLLKCHLTDSVSKKAEYFKKVIQLDPNNEQATVGLEAIKSLTACTEPKPEISEVAKLDFQVSEEMFAPAEEYVVSYETKIEVSKPAPVAEVAEETEVFEQAQEKTEQPEELKIEEAVAEVPEPVSEPDFVADAQAVEVEMADEPSVQEIVDEETEMDYAFQESETHFAEEPKTEETSEPVAETPSYEEVIEEANAFEAEAETAAETTPVVEAEEQVFENDHESVAIDEVSPDVEAEMESSPIAMPDEVLELNERVVEQKHTSTMLCPFCSSENDEHGFICNSCRAMMTMTDVDLMLDHSDANLALVQQKVELLESKHGENKLDAESLKVLGIGLLNLKNLKKSHEYLLEASQLEPNDVVLSSHVNSLAIRLSEIEDQKPAQDSTPKNKTILVVDDSATVRKLVSGKLEKCGLEVICAVDGMDALEKINESIPDLILLDITMPRMDGYQVCKMIRGNEATKDVPVVMISGKDGFFDKVRGRMAGTTGYITKPFGPETLMKTVEAYIE